jgi:methylmalonyl-CoA mutase
MLVSSSPFHDAGASAVDELALTLAAGVEALRRAVAAGLGVRAAVSRTLFAFSIADDLFLEIAKLRAGRLLWSKVSSAAGVRSGAWTWICARASMRGFSHDDPRTNLLRNAVRCFAAFAGGADGAALPPHDPRPDAPAAAGRRLAVMTQQVLLQEAGLDRIFDPAGGSWYLESLTDRLARAAWKLFQELEGAGGIVRCLRDGRVDEIVRRSAERREAAAEEG